MLALGGLFLAAFLAATLIPAQSEAVLVGLIPPGGHPVWLLLALATVGSVLGSVANWALSRLLAHRTGARWFPLSPAQLDRAASWCRRWGFWSLLAAWMPVNGPYLPLNILVSNVCFAPHSGRSDGSPIAQRTIGH